MKKGFDWNKKGSDGLLGEESTTGFIKKDQELWSDISCG
jgi:hypothetical protein